MMGHREPLKDGDEYDGFTSRRYHRWRSGVLRAIKRRFSKRVRKLARLDTQNAARIDREGR